MKLKYLAMSAIVALFGMTSCEDDGTGNQDDLKPVVILDGTGAFISGDATVEVDEAISFRLTGSENDISGKNLKNLKIQRVFKNDPVVVLDTNINGSNFGPLTINTTAQSTAGEENWVFEITDNDNVVGKASLVITTAPAAVPFEEKDGQFYHILGQLKGAFDLQAGVERSASENASLKDMMNNDKNSDGSSKTFTGSWVAGDGNGSTFKKASAGFDYDNANSSNTAFDFNVTQLATPATSGVTAPVAGDVYLVNLRGQGVYGAIKIVSVDANFSTGTGANKGKITFKFKRGN